MDTNETQLDSTGQEADVNSVAPKLGLDQASLSDLLKSSFLNEEEESAPAQAEQEETSEEPDVLDETVDQSDEESDQPVADESSLSKGVQKRINKLVAAKKAAQAELDAQKATLSQLQAELEAAKSSVSAKPVEFSDYAASLDTPKKVEEEYSRALNTLLWCEDNSDGGEMPLRNGEKVFLSVEEVRAIKRNAIIAREIELPKRMQYLQAQGTAEAEAAKDFPWYSNPASEEYQFSQTVVKEFPEIKRRADWKHVVGLLTLGAKAYNEMKAKKTTPTPIKRAPVQPSARALPAATAQSDIQKARQNFAKNTSDKGGLTDLVKAMGLV
jgi:hypothetical protein